MPIHPKQILEDQLEKRGAGLEDGLATKNIGVIWEDQMNFRLLYLSRILTTDPMVK